MVFLCWPDNTGDSEATRMNDIAREPIIGQPVGHQNIPDSRGINFF